MANEDKSARYHRLRRRAALLDTGVQAGFLVALVASGASLAIRGEIEAAVGTGLVVVALSYVVAIASLSEVIHLPFAFYQGVVLERRYGLSRETTGQWLADHVKAVAIVLGYLSLGGIIVAALMRSSPEHWWITAALCFSVMLVLLARFAPMLLPLFYDVRPLAREELRTRLMALADRAGTPVLDVFEWRLGDRTSKANAVLVGIGRTRRILVSDTLLAAHSDQEIETVFAHELAHHVYGDIWSALALEVVLVTLGCYVADVVLTPLAPLVGLEAKSDVAGLPLIALAIGIVSLLLRPLTNALSRAHERRADRYALETTRNSSAFISVMKRLASTNLAEERPSRVVELFFHTHPSTAARIEAARNWAHSSRAPTLGAHLERVRGPEA